MARVTFDPGIRGYRGTAGNQVFKRHRGKTIVTKKPDMSGVVRSEAQKACNTRFAEAIEYAKRAMDHPDLGPIYREAARRTERVAFRVAVSDFMRPPVVKDIDLSAYAGTSGDVITIEAVDEWHVAAVTIRLTDAAGAVVEEGPAEEDVVSGWVYTATTSVPSGSVVRIEATAADLPGHAHTAVQEMQVRGEDKLHAAPHAVDVMQHAGTEWELQGEAECDEIIESLSRISEIVQGQDLTALTISSSGACPPENVRLALKLLLEAEELLRTSVAAVDDGEEPDREPLESCRPTQADRPPIALSRPRESHLDPASVRSQGSDFVPGYVAFATPED